jgi:hypothetical protein
VDAGDEVIYYSNVAISPQANGARKSLEKNGGGVAGENGQPRRSPSLNRQVKI